MNRIVGVIFRGSLWLDGLFTYTAGTNDKRYVTGLASTMKQSKQYSQIHAAVFSRENDLPNGVQDFDHLADEIDLPILVLRHSKFRNQKLTSIWSPNKDPVTVNELFAIGCAEKMTIPEAVRVAELIANRL
ncbi:MAG: hypothetical protein ABSF09_02460 [Candidatus Bathyarchaeia archaeon]